MNYPMLGLFRRIAKRLQAVREGNAALKTWLAKRRHARNVASYANRTSYGSTETLLTRRGGERLRKLREYQGQWHVMYVGTNWEQDSSGMLQGLSTVAKLTEFRDASGSYGQRYPAGNRAIWTRNAVELEGCVENLDRAGKLPHLLLAQTWAHWMDPEVLSRLKDRFGVVVATIGMDDRHIYCARGFDGRPGGTFGLIPYTDLHASIAPECVEWFRKEGCPAHFFPLASDPVLFRPMPWLPKEFDVAFVGTRYGIRERIVVALRAVGLRVAAYGAGWHQGRLDNEGVARLFAQSRIVLGVGGLGHATDFVALKLRDFDAPMSGSLYLTTGNSDFHDLYDVGREIVTYEDVDDCVEKALELLKNEPMREQIAAAGRARAERDHTWHKRYGELFSILKGRTEVQSTAVSATPGQAFAAGNSMGGR